MVSNVVLTDEAMGIASRLESYDDYVDEREPAREVWDSELHDAEAAALIELIDDDPDPAGVPRQYARGRRLEHPKIRLGIDPEQLQKLCALGYVE